ncbi:MAG: rRNA pseudouridine synthase [Lentisphaeria bacterium]|nr:rRNA pseudouridine synthase [Lentisphaeria bacterium]
MAETLGKIISEAAFLSRRAAVTAVKSGRVRINGKVCMNPAERIAPGMKILFDRRPLEIPDLTEKWYVMLNKPTGYVCTASDPHAPLKALDLIVPAPPVRLFSAGRLDKESSGMILFSNDGDFVAQLTHPRYQIVKRYQVRLAAELTPEAQKQMIRGVKDDGEVLRVLKVRSLGGCRYELFLNEGKKREIRRLTAALGAPTLELDRLAIGALELGALPRGEWRRLSDREVKAALTSGSAAAETKEH